MKCEYKNYLYIYNIKLVEENIQFNTIAPSKGKNKQNNTKGKRPLIESKYQKKIVKNNNNKATFKKKTSTCYKCGKIGYYLKYCQLENKINSLKISINSKI